MQVPRPTRIVNNPIQEDVQLKATVAQVPKTCPNCGYPVMGDFSSCPNCGTNIGPAPKPTTIQNLNGQSEPAVATPLTAATEASKSALKELGIDETVKCTKCGTEVSIDFSYCPKCGERIHLPTVRAIRHKPIESPKPKCHLTIIPEEEEQIEPITIDYEGASVILTRDNTESNNRTITTKEQAELICEDKKWYILNKSELGSTYLEANRKLELQQGDIIVLGDRRFKFEAE
jgi:predicted Zn-ribbon and HTH transcriptional regulator